MESRARKTHDEAARKQYFCQKTLDRHSVVERGSYIHKHSGSSICFASSRSRDLSSSFVS